MLIFTFCPDVINVSGHRLSTAEIESALIVHKGVAETAGMFVSRLHFHVLPDHAITVIGTTDELTGQAVHAFVTLKPCVFNIAPGTIADQSSSLLGSLNTVARRRLGKSLPSRSARRSGRLPPRRRSGSCLISQRRARARYV